MTGPTAPRPLNLLGTATGRKILFAALYLSEGAPIGFIWWALPTKLRAAGVALPEITLLTSALTVPWTLKFLAAPLVDTVRSPRWTLRSWIMSAQLLMGVALLPLLRLDLREDLSVVFVLLLAHAIAAAIQDVAVDALSISYVPSAQRGSINGWMQAGMLAGRSLLGGGALKLAEITGDQSVILVLVGAVWLSLVLVFFAREPTPVGPGAAARDRARSFSAHLKRALRQRTTWLGLLFAGLAGAGFEAVGAVAGPFLIDRGFSTGEVGSFFSLLSVPCMIGGALLGGALADRLGKRRAAASFLAVLAFVIFLVAAADVGWSQGGHALTLTLLSALYFSIGLFTAASYALFMDLTDPALAATQFSAFMASTNVCESWSAFTVGRLVPAWGYAAAFAAMAMLSLLGLPVLRALPAAERQPPRGPVGA